jgi:hypothetical protein
VVEQLIPAAMDRHVLGDAERAVLRGTIPVVFDTDVLRDMYASHERRTFAGERLEEACLAIVSQRAPLNLGLVLVTNAPSPGVADGESAGAAANDDASQPACKQA